MAANDYLFTSESVSEGHPDKVCDRISDEIVDLFLRRVPVRARRLRDAGHDQPRRDRRRGPAGPGSRITPDLIAHTARMAIKDIGYEQDGFHWHNAKIDVLLHEQSADIAMGVDAGAHEGRGRRRPGHHVRLRHRRDAGADAGADPVRPRFAAPARRRPAFRRAVPARARREEPVHPALCRRPAGRRHLGRALDPACRGPSRRTTSGDRPALRAGDPARGLDVPGGRVLRQPDRQVRDRRPGRRRRPDRPQDHRRHLWRCGTAWRRRLLRQGPDQGRPLRGLRRALSGEERGRRRARRALRDPALLRHRRLQAAVDLRRHLRHRRGRRAAAGQGAQRGDEPEPARHPRASRSSTVRSTPAPLPTAISAAAARRTAASPGSAPTSPTSCAARSTEPRELGRRGSAARAACPLRPPPGPQAAPGPPASCSSDRCRGWALRSCPGSALDPRRLFAVAAAARSGSRSASAAASIWRRRPQPIRRSASSASSRSSTASPSSCGRSSSSGWAMSAS